MESNVFKLLHKDFPSQRIAVEQFQDVEIKESFFIFKIRAAFNNVLEEAYKTTVEYLYIIVSPKL
jgi:hypothetical protein